MNDLALVLIALAMVVVGSETVLGGRKLQTGLARLLPVWFLVGAAVMIYFAVARGSGTIVFAVFWGGAFLSWFGIRSHVESSILLRMLYLLRPRPMSGAELVGAYERAYGPQQRVDELVRSGLAERRPDGNRVTPKGERVLAAVDWLR